MASKLPGDHGVGRQRAATGKPPSPPRFPELWSPALFSAYNHRHLAGMPARSRAPGRFDGLLSVTPAPEPRGLPHAPHPGQPHKPAGHHPHPVTAASKLWPALPTQ